MDVCVYNTRCMGPDHMENIAELACRTALSYRGVSHISRSSGFPGNGSDITRATDAASATSRSTSPKSARTSARIPCEEDLRHAADVLNHGKRIAILAGRGALRAGNELEQTAEKLSAPIVKALLGKAAVPDDSPYTTGTIGLLGTKPSQEAMEECDTLFIVGSSFPYIEFLPKPGQARGVQIDLDPMRIGLRYPVEVGLVGDCKRTLEKLLPMLRGNGKKEFSRRGPSRHERLAKTDGQAGQHQEQADEAAVGGGRAG